MGDQLTQAIQAQQWGLAALYLMVGAARALEHDQEVITLMHRRHLIRQQTRGAEELPEAIALLTQAALRRAP